MYDLIPGIGKKYIISTKETGEECDCLLYAMDGSNKICYKNEEKYFNNEKRYAYKLGNQCIEENQCNFKVEGGADSGYLKKCFRSATKCKKNNYPYYFSTTSPTGLKEHIGFMHKFCLWYSFKSTIWKIYHLLKLENS